MSSWEEGGEMTADEKDERVNIQIDSWFGKLDGVCDQMKFSNRL